MDTGISNAAPNVPVYPQGQHRTDRRKDQRIGGCIYEHIACFVEDTASGGIGQRVNFDNRIPARY